MEKPVFSVFLKIIGVKNRLTMTFVKILRVIRYQRLDILPPHTQNLKQNEKFFLKLYNRIKNFVYSKYNPLIN